MPETVTNVFNGYSCLLDLGDRVAPQESVEMVKFSFGVLGSLIITVFSLMTLSSKSSDTQCPLLTPNLILRPELEAAMMSAFCFCGFHIHEFNQQWIKTI
jgi:hypothetical protein